VRKTALWKRVRATPNENVPYEKKTPQEDNNKNTGDGCQSVSGALGAGGGKERQVGSKL